MATATKAHPSTVDVAYELSSDGRLLPYESSKIEGAERCYDRAGRKSRTALYGIRLRHDQEVKKMLEREQRLGRIAPPEELRGLPLVASFMLWRLGNSVADYLSASTFTLHRKIIRASTGLDLSIALDRE